MSWHQVAVLCWAAILLSFPLVGCSSPAAPLADNSQPAKVGAVKEATKTGSATAAAPVSEGGTAAAEPTTADLPALIDGFQSPFNVRVYETTEQFRKLPAELRRSVLADLSEHESATVRQNAWRAFATWATRDDVPTIVAAAESPHEDVRSAALTLLARFPRAETFGVLTNELENQLGRERAEQLLVSAGPAAELPVLAYITHADAGLRAAAWRILGQIGSRRSLLALEQVATQTAFQNDAELKGAMEQIRERLRK